jgi:copper chaperone CopZ
MKSTLLTLSAFLALGLIARAESTVTLNNIHNCCASCEKGITKAVTSVKGATVTATKTSATITAKNKGDADKAVDALLKAGFYGEGAPAQTAPDKKVTSATVSGTHLCCGKCIKGIDEAVKNTPGATSHDATKGAKSFKVTGDFNLKDLVAALNKAGYAGKVE